MAEVRAAKTMQTGTASKTGFVSRKIKFKNSLFRKLNDAVPLHFIEQGTLARTFSRFEILTRKAGRDTTLLSHLPMFYQ